MEREWWVRGYHVAIYRCVRRFQCSPKGTVITARWRILRRLMCWWPRLLVQSPSMVAMTKEVPPAWSGSSSFRRGKNVLCCKSRFTTFTYHVTVVYDTNGLNLNMQIFCRLVFRYSNWVDEIDENFPWRKFPTIRFIYMSSFSFQYIM